MAYTTIDKPEDHFNIVTYSGNDTNNRSITGLGFQPDLTWIKMSQSQTSDHALFDSNRGTNKKLASNTTAAEVSPSQYGGVGSFDSDGFTLVNGTTQVLSSYMFEVNKTSETYVAWNWKANAGSTSSNTDGTITSTVQVNTDAGFSIVTFTSPSSGSFSMGHGLGVKPDMVITKSLSNTSGWWTWHKGLTNDTTYYLDLSTTAGQASVSNMWGTTGFTSSVFGMNYPASAYANSNYIAYCFAEKQGFSKFGTYTGNGNANGTFVYTGFRPAFVMIKATSGVMSWGMHDVKRNAYNPVNCVIGANVSNADSCLTAHDIDILSNGFKLRNSSSGWINASGYTLIYMAFAENPFVTSTGIPTTAR